MRTSLLDVPNTAMFATTSATTTPSTEVSARKPLAPGAVRLGRSNEDVIVAEVRDSLKALLGQRVVPVPPQILVRALAEFEAELEAPEVRGSFAPTSALEMLRRKASLARSKSFEFELAALEPDALVLYDLDGELRAVRRTIEGTLEFFRVV